MKDGDTIQLVVNFNLRDGTFPSGNGTMTYQLPGGLKLDKKIERDNIIDEATGKPMGTYSIDTNGLVTMNFTGIGSGAAFDGKLTFKAKADLATAPDGKISFGNNMELQVTKKDPDLSVTKGFAEKSVWSDAEGNFYIYWKVTASTKNGSGSPVDIWDVLPQGSLPSSFDPTNSNGPVSITHYDAAGNKKLLTDEYEISTDGKKLSYTGPAGAAGR